MRLRSVCLKVITDGSHLFGKDDFHLYTTFVYPCLFRIAAKLLSGALRFEVKGQLKNFHTESQVEHVKVPLFWVPYRVTFHAEQAAQGLKCGSPRGAHSAQRKQ